MKKILAMLLCVLMLMSVISACSSGNDDGNGGETPDNSNSEENNEQLDLSNGTESIGDKPEGWTEADATESIHFTTTAQCNTMERWTLNVSESASFWSYLLFDAPLSRDEDGNIIPWLCDEYEMAEDNMSISFHVRDGVYFTNGHQCTAEDLVFTFNSICNSERYPDSVAKSWRNYVDRVEQDSDMDFTIYFSKLMPEFWVQIVDPKVTVVDKELFDEIGADEYWKNPVGTGAYQIKKWDSANTYLELEIRTDEHGYFGYDVEDNWTNVKYITIEYSPEEQTRLAALRTGETDILSSVATTEIENLVAEGYICEKVKENNLRFIQFACAEGDPFYDRDLREAFSLCLDRELLAETIMNGYATAISWPARETDIGYVENPELTYKYDPDRARELVENSTYNGEELTLIFTTSTCKEGNELAVAIQSLAAEVGINITVRTCETAIYDELRNAHDFDLCIAQIGGGDNNWYKISADVIASDRFNSGLTDQILIDAASKIATTIDQDVLQELYVNVYTQLLTSFDCLIEVYWPQEIIVFDPKVTGVLHHNAKYSDIHAIVVTEA